jgi:predicted amidohydrolase YtcJ
MRKTIAVFLSLEITVVLLVFGHSNPVFASEADLILYNGKIVTVNSDFSVQQAMAVKDNQILQVGDNKDIMRLKTEKTEVLNLDGKTVLPGFIDSHANPTNGFH